MSVIFGLKMVKENYKSLIFVMDIHKPPGTKHESP